MREAFAIWRQSVFFLGVHFAERAVESIRQKQRIVTEAFCAAWGPDGDTIDTAFEIFGVTVGPGKAERGDEVTAPLVRGAGSALDEQRLDAVHRKAEIFIRPRPTRRIDSRLTVERLDDEAGVVGEGGQPGSFRSGERLDARVGLESFSCFLRFGQ